MNAKHLKYCWFFSNVSGEKGSKDSRGQGSKCLFFYDFIGTCPMKSLFFYFIGVEIAIGIGIEYLLHVKLGVSLNIISSFQPG